MDPSPADAVTDVGEPGTPAGVAVNAADAALVTDDVPTVAVTVTVNV
jgi:hypothetical protein